MAEEYLEARSRLYRMVYMHKTTRAAEKMLEFLLKNAQQIEVQHEEPVLRHVRAPSLHSYLDLDDATVWAALTTYAEEYQGPVSELAKRLRTRQLYKGIDIAKEDTAGNLLNRFRARLAEEHNLRDIVLIDDATVTPYKWYDFEDSSALNKVLVKTRGDASEPQDIVNESEVVKPLRDKTRIQRAYAPDRDAAETLQKLLKEVQQ